MPPAIQPPAATPRGWAIECIEGYGGTIEVSQVLRVSTPPARTALISRAWLEPGM
jgi:hypothetical protein